MSYYASVYNLPLLWFSGVISDVSSSAPEELGLCVTLWSPSDPAFSCRRGLYVPVGATIGDFDLTVIRDIFCRLTSSSLVK
jgi:hypothetical protein